MQWNCGYCRLQDGKIMWMNATHWLTKPQQDCTWESTTPRTIQTTSDYDCTWRLTTKQKAWRKCNWRSVHTATTTVYAMSCHGLLWVVMAVWPRLSTSQGYSILHIEAVIGRALVSTEWKVFYVLKGQIWCFSPCSVFPFMLSACFPSSNKVKCYGFPFFFFFSCFFFSFLCKFWFLLLSALAVSIRHSDDEEVYKDLCEVLLYLHICLIVYFFIFSIFFMPKNHFCGFCFLPRFHLLYHSEPILRLIMTSNIHLF